MIQAPLGYLLVMVVARFALTQQVTRIRAFISFSGDLRLYNNGKNECSFHAKKSLVKLREIKSQYYAKRRPKTLRSTPKHRR